MLWKARNSMQLMMQGAAMDISILRLSEMKKKYFRISYTLLFQFVPIQQALSVKPISRLEGKLEQDISSFQEMITFTLVGLFTSRCIVSCKR